MTHAPETSSINRVTDLRYGKSVIDILTPFSGAGFGAGFSYNIVWN